MIAVVAVVVVVVLLAFVAIVAVAGGTQEWTDDEALPTGEHREVYK